MKKFETGNKIINLRNNSVYVVIKNDNYISYKIKNIITKLTFVINYSWINSGPWYKIIEIK